MCEQETQPQSPAKPRRSSRVRSEDAKEQVETTAIGIETAVPNKSNLREFSSEQRDSLGFQRMEEYKVVVQNHAGISARRQSATNLFVSLNVVFLTAMGFVLLSSRLTSWWAVAAMGAIALSITPINLTWYFTLKRYQKVIFGYYQYLQEIEKELQGIW